MKTLTLILKLTAPCFVIVAAIHIVFGVSAESMLGAQLSAQSLQDPVLDSQNRFYGASFMLYAVVFWLAASDLEKYILLLRASLVVFCISGCVRFLSIAQLGWPSTAVTTLMWVEIVGPLLMLFWIRRVAAKADFGITHEG